MLSEIRCQEPRLYEYQPSATPVPFCPPLAPNSKCPAAPGIIGAIRSMKSAAFVQSGLAVPRLASDAVAIPDRAQSLASEQMPAAACLPPLRSGWPKSKSYKIPSAHAKRCHPAASVSVETTASVSAVIALARGLPELAP